MNLLRKVYSLVSLVKLQTVLFLYEQQQFWRMMKGNQKDIEIDTNISYSTKTQSFNKPLKLTNHSDHVYVFKIKTNQRTVVSLQTTHDFIKPHSIKEIQIKLAEKPSETTPLKLEFNYAIPTEEDIQNKDSKMVSYNKQSIFKSVIIVQKNDDLEVTKLNSPKTQKITLGSPEKPKEQEKMIVSTPLKFQAKEETVEIPKESKVLSGKGEVINITNFIDVGKIESFESEKTTKIDPFKDLPEEKIEKKYVETTFTKVESQEIQIPIKTEEPLENNNSLPTETIFYSGKRQFKPSESFFPGEAKETVEQQVLIGELVQKIEKEKTTIRNLKASSTYGSVYPLPIILMMIVVSFGIGSFIESILA